MEDMLTSNVDLPITDIEEELSDAQKADERAEEKSEIALAGLRNTDGWTVFRALIQSDLERLERHTDLDYPGLTDAELGREIRTDRILAEKLRGYLLKVDQAEEFVDSLDDDQAEGGGEDVE